MAEAKRIISFTNKVTTDWTRSYGTEGSDTAFQLDTKAVMAQTVPGESLMVVDVSFTYDFFFANYFGKSQVFNVHYSAGVPSY